MFLAATAQLLRSVLDALPGWPGACASRRRVVERCAACRPACRARPGVGEWTSTEADRVAMPNASGSLRSGDASSRTDVAYARREPLAGRRPYLLQHAENPVDWYEWGDEAFERARRGQAAPRLGRLQLLPLVPRHGARVVRGQRDGRAHERALREREGRPRGAPRRRRGDDGGGGRHDRVAAAGRRRSS